MAGNKVDSNSGVIDKNVDLIVVSGTTEQTVYSYLVKGGTLGRTKDINFKLLATLTLVGAPAAAPPSLTLTIKFGTYALAGAERHARHRLASR